MIMQVVIPVWIEALYHAFEYAAFRYGSWRIWQLSGAKLQQILYDYQVCTANTDKCHVDPARGLF